MEKIATSVGAGIEIWQGTSNMTFAENNPNFANLQDFKKNKIAICTCAVKDS